MERIENRHNSDTQTAIFEETSDALSIADMLKRTLEHTITSGESMTHTACSQKLPPEKLIKFLIAAEGGPLAKELHRAGIDAAPAAVSQRRRQIPPAVFWPVTVPRLIWSVTPARPALSATTARRRGTINYI